MKPLIAKGAAVVAALAAVVAIVGLIILGFYYLSVDSGQALPYNLYQLNETTHGETS